MSGRRLYVVTAAMMLSLFLASIETTVVATAMPTIVSQLGGLGIYAWVFSAYMLTSTTAVPIFGKLSDIYGRRSIYLISVAIFLVGSALCGQAQSMEQLILFRALQGVGAGGLLPLAFTIIGDIFTFEQRAKMQGVFSGVWGVSSVIGPLVGGFLVDQASWRWVFYINILPGLVAALLMVLAWKDVSPRAGGRVDYAGAAFLTGGIVTLLLAMFELGQAPSWNGWGFWSLLVVSIILFAGLLIVEKRAANPILPLGLFRERLFSTAIGHGFASGFALFGSASFVPFYVESVLGTSATAAGAALTPLMVAWVGASIIGSRLLLRFRYRSLALVGMSALVLGSVGMFLQIGIDTPYGMIALAVALMGIGMGLSIPAFLIAVQSSVPRQSLGTATSTVQFSRSIGGTIGVSIMGVVMTLRLNQSLATSGIDPATVSLDALLDSTTRAGISMEPIRASLAVAVQSVFGVALAAAIAALAVTMLAPREKIGDASSDQRIAQATAGARLSKGASGQR